MYKRQELDGATICIQTGTTTELNLADFFKTNNISYTPVTIQDDAEGQRQFLAGACDAYTTDASGLASLRATLPAPADYVILPEIISKEPLGPVVRHGDNQWGDIVPVSYTHLDVYKRQDKDTSGVLMLARTDRVARALSEALRHHNTRKIYWAAVAGVPHPRKGSIKYALQKAPGHGRGGEGEKMMCIHPAKVADYPDAKRAQTDYFTLWFLGNRLSWICLLYTSRCV